MKSSSLKAAALAISVLALSVPAAARAEWLRADTKHFIIYSEGRESELTDFAVNAEKFDALLRNRFKTAAEDDTGRLPIYILADSKAVSELKGLKGDNLAGFYTTSSEGAFAVSNRDKKYGPLAKMAQETLFHEYTHHFFTRYVAGSYPIWLFEGFAEYFSTAKFEKDGGYTVGSVANSRAYGLLFSEPLPIARILTGNLAGLNARQTDVFYGRSWLLTHRLMSTAEGREQLVNFINAFNSGVSAEDAATQSFGLLDELDEQLVKATRKGLVAFTSHDPISYDPAVRVSSLDKVDSDLLELHIHRQANYQPPETLAALRALAVRAPDRAPVLAELAAAEFEGAQDAEDEASEQAGYALAEAAADKALAIDGKNVAAALAKGRAILEHNGNRPSEEEITAARRMFVRANNADPTNPRALYEYYRSFAEFGERPPEMAIRGLESAYVQAPEMVEYRVALAFAFANQGKFDTAMPLVRYLAYHPHMAAQGERLVEQLGQMQSRWEEGNRDAEEEPVVEEIED